MENAEFKVEYGTKADYSNAVTVNTTAKSIAVNNFEKYKILCQNNRFG
ncbi:MAG: hypothetical protein ACLR56_10395 [Oscillospiraceae bacterium]